MDILFLLYHRGVECDEHDEGDVCVMCMLCFNKLCYG